MLSKLQIHRVSKCRHSKRLGESFPGYPSALPVLSLWSPFFPLPMASSHLGHGLRAAMRRTGIQRNEQPARGGTIRRRQKEMRPYPVRSEGGLVEIRYLGFEQKLNSRAYQFDVREGEQPR